MALAWVGLAMVVGCADSKRKYSSPDVTTGGTGGTTGGSSPSGGTGGTTASGGSAGSSTGGSSIGGSTGNGEGGGAASTTVGGNGGTSGSAASGGTAGDSGDAGEAGSGGTGLTIPVEPGRPGTTLVSGGMWMESETYRGFSVTGQSQVGVVGTSEGYRIHGGIVGATQPGPAAP